MSNIIIRQVLESRLQEWAEERTSPLNVVYENVILENENKPNQYIEVKLIPSKNKSESLDGLHETLAGVFVARVYTKKHYGPANAEQIAQEIKELFPCDLRLVSGGITIIIDEPVMIKESTPTDRNYIVPVLITYRSDVIH